MRIKWICELDHRCVGVFVTELCPKKSIVPSISVRCVADNWVPQWHSDVSIDANGLYAARAQQSYISQSRVVEWR